MYYSDETIAEVISRNDIADVVGMYVHLTKKGANYWGLCPFHGEKTASFSVNTNKQMFYCFGCHKGGSVITFLMEYENIPFQEAVKELAERGGVQLPEVRETEEDVRNRNFIQRLFDVNKLAAEYFFKAAKTERGKLAINYFKKRGLSDETILHWGLGYSQPFSDDLYKFLKSKGYNDDFLKDTGLVTISERGATDKFWNRAMFPIMDERDRVIAFGGRVMGEGEPKYLNSPETKVFDKGFNLYGLNYARHSGKNFFLLCEGYMDVISLHQAGFTNAVASLGTALTDRNALKLSKYVKDVYLTYDSDGAGTKASLRAIPILEARGITVKVVNMQPHKDPDEFIKALGAEEYQKRIDNAESSFFFELRIKASGFNMEEPKEKNDFYEYVAGRMLDISNELERSTYEEAFAKRYKVDLKKFHELVIEKARREGPRKPAYGTDTDAERFPKKKFENAAEKKMDDKILQPQRLLLTCLSDDPGLYARISGVVDPSEFTEGLYRKVAELAYGFCKDSGSVNPARIVSCFEEKEDQEKVGAIFQTDLPGEVNDAERAKAIEDTVRKIKLNSVEEKINSAIEAEDGQLVNELLKTQTALKNRKNLLS
ncbi:MAG: DNA primase [Lachnospiraceae bacterium]|nr:DNA primase [Lachnospiraceae bacterium]